jgi:hypothetical protein
VRQVEVDRVPCNGDDRHREHDIDVHLVLAEVDHDRLHQLDPNQNQQESAEDIVQQPEALEEAGHVRAVDRPAAEPPDDLTEKLDGQHTSGPQYDHHQDDQQDDDDGALDHLVHPEQQAQRAAHEHSLTASDWLTLRRLAPEARNGLRIYWSIGSGTTRSPARAEVALNRSST